MKRDQNKSFIEIKDDENILLENVFYNKSNSSKTVFISEFNYLPKSIPTKELGFRDYFANGAEKVKNYSRAMISATLSTVFGVKNNIISSLNEKLSSIFEKTTNVIDYIFHRWFGKESILTEELCFLASQYSKHNKDDRRFSDLRLFDLFTKLPILTISLHRTFEYQRPMKDGILIDNTTYSVKSIVESWQLYKNDTNILQVSSDYSFWCYLYYKTDNEVKDIKTIPITRDHPFEGFIDDKIKMETFKPFIFKGNEPIPNRLSLGYKRHKDL